MGSLIFCNAENRAFDFSEFVEGPDNTTIHTTRTPHTLDGWPAQEGKNGTWVIIEDPAIAALPDIAENEPPGAE